MRTDFLANRGFASRHPKLLEDAVAGLREAAAWADGHKEAVARALADVTGVPFAAQKVAADRSVFGVEPITDAILAGQQATADRFHKLGLIPHAITVRDAVWTAPPS